MEFITWEFISLIVVIVGSLLTAAKLQLDVNAKIFIELAKIKKDVEQNKTEVEEYVLECTKKVEENVKHNAERIDLYNKSNLEHFNSINENMKSFNETNYQQHDSIVKSIEKLYQYLVTK